MKNMKLTPEDRKALIHRDIFAAGPASIHAEWTTWPKWLFDLEIAGLSFHLDDDPFDIIHLKAGENVRVFTDEEAEAIKKRVDHIFDNTNDPWEFFPMPDDVDNFCDAHTVFTMEEFEAEMEMTREEITGNDETTDTHVHYFGGGYITEDRNAGKFHLFLERSEWEAPTLEDLAGYLFNWWNAETGGFVYSKKAFEKAAKYPRQFDRLKLIKLLKGHDEADGDSYDELSHEEAAALIKEAANG